MRASLPTPALDRWHRELAAGQRTPLVFDQLWRNACAEANALEAEALGLTIAATRYRAEAARLHPASPRRRPRLLSSKHQRLAGSWEGIRP